MRIVDAHVHFWNPARLPYPWLDGVPALNRAFEPADLTSATGQETIEELVFVEAGRAPAANIEEAAWVTELAKRDPRIRGIVAHAAVERGAAVTDELARLAKLPLVKGVRRLLQDEADDAFCLRPGFIEGVHALAPFQFSFDLCIYHRQLPSVIGLVRACPEVGFILDHAGKPGIRGRLLDPWRDNLRTLASFPNVRCKLSGLVTEADHARWQPAELSPYIEHVLACFGFDRTMFASDWPVVNLAGNYRQWLKVVLDAVSGATDAQRQRLFRDNARETYRL